jgi:hypothetical protein
MPTVAAEQPEVSRWSSFQTEQIVSALTLPSNRAGGHRIVAAAEPDLLARFPQLGDGFLRLGPKRVGDGKARADLVRADLVAIARYSQPLGCEKDDRLGAFLPALNEGAGGKDRTDRRHQRLVADADLESERRLACHARLGGDDRLQAAADDLFRCAGRDCGAKRGRCGKERELLVGKGLEGRCQRMRRLRLELAQGR